jgi:hypothetical protein
MNTLFLLLILFFASRQVKDKNACRCIYLLMGLLAFNYLYDGYCNFEVPGAGYQINAPEATCEVNPTWESSGAGAASLGAFESDATATTLLEKRVSCRTRITNSVDGGQQADCEGASKSTGAGLSVTECLYTTPTCARHGVELDCNQEPGCIYEAGGGTTAGADCTGADDGSGTDATCTGTADGAGGSCTLSASGGACAVDGGDCSFTEAVAGAACSLNAGADACAVQDGGCTYTPATTATTPVCRPLVPGQDRISPTHLKSSYGCATPGYEGSPSLMMKESIEGTGAPWATVAENYGFVERTASCDVPGNADDTALMTLGGCSVPTQNETCSTAKGRLGNDACGSIGWKYHTLRTDLPTGSRLVAGDLNSLTCASAECAITSGTGADAQKCCKEQMPCHLNESLAGNTCGDNLNGELIGGVPSPTGFSTTYVDGYDPSIDTTLRDWTKLNDQLCSGAACDLTLLGNVPVGSNDRDTCCRESVSCETDIWTKDNFKNVDLAAIKALLNNPDLCGDGTKAEMLTSAKLAIQGVKVAEAAAAAAAGEDSDLDQYCDWDHSYDSETGQCCLYGTLGQVDCDGPSFEAV